MKMNTPLSGISRFSLVLTLRTTIFSTMSLPSMDSSTESMTGTIFGVAQGVIDNHLVGAELIAAVHQINF